MRKFSLVTTVLPPPFARLGGEAMRERYIGLRHFGKKLPCFLKIPPQNLTISRSFLKILRQFRVPSAIAFRKVAAPFFRGFMCFMPACPRFAPDVPACLSAYAGFLSFFSVVDAEVLQKMTPYGIAVHPRTREIFITDAGNYINPGTLYCFDRDGRLKWQQRTGNVPGHLIFVR